MAVWQSLNDFPVSRRTIQSYAQPKKYLIVCAQFVPIICLSYSLIITAATCGADEPSEWAKNTVLYIGKGLTFISPYTTPDLHETGLKQMNIHLDYFCYESPFSYIAVGYDLPRRILTLLVILMIGHSIISKILEDVKTKENRNCRINQISQRQKPK
jgi:hypothetical protein